LIISIYRFFLETTNSGWAETPKTDRGGMDDADYIIRSTPTPSTDKRRSRWDETPANQTTTNGASFTPVTKEIGVASTPRTSSGFTPGMTPIIATPVGARAINMATPTPSQISMTPEQMQAYRWEREIDERNRPLSDEELDAMFPPGYKVLPPPQSGLSGFHIQESAHGQNAQSGQLQEYQPSGNLPLLKPDDLQYFDKLLQEVDEEALSPEEQKERKIMKLLLKIKNGTPPMRKAALRQITDKAREFGAGPLFNQILPLLMSPTLEDQERHLLVKVIDRILYKLDDLVRPYVHKICVVIEPLLIDEDYYARVEGREIISNLAKAAGLATMISTMRPDIDNLDEYVRNTTARAFAVVASALGIPALLPFLKAVCKSKKSWQARHTGIKIIQQIAILLGCAILPHLKSLVEIIEHGKKKVISFFIFN
jgi:splicing factor 3B subunit 1